ncbi:MAG: rhomboid family intramembrane serine protease [Pirellulaceae bacterium]
MIPIRDNIQPRRWPWVNYLMIALCTIAFAAQMMSGDGGAALAERWGMIPARVTNPGKAVVVPAERVVSTIFGPQVIKGMRQLPAAPVSDWLTLLTCIFLHGGLMHFLGNMWFLHIFGDNVEDRLGHGIYLLLYLGCGLIASLTHLASDLQSPIPTIGASGAIAGVMGAYLLLYPKAKVMSVLPLLIIFPVIILPAWIFLGLWFAFQFYNGWASMNASEQTGVAWFAHVGGFVAGMALAVGMKFAHHVSPPVDGVLAGTEKDGFYPRGG